MIGELRLAIAATHEPNVTEVGTTIRFDRLDFCCIVRRDSPLPVEPTLPTIGQCVGQVNVHDTCPFPMPAPPSR